MSRISEYVVRMRCVKIKREDWSRENEERKIDG